MEKIDKTNYEAYFLDYMEGTLSAEGEADLMSFLDEHPNLKSELATDMNLVPLFPEEIVFENKDVLRIDQSDLILIPATIPDLIIASVEKQLSPKHEAQLLAFITKEGLEQTYLSYTNTILRPDLTVVYEGKEKLKVTTGMIISLSFVKRAAAVAAVGLMLVTLAINWNSATGDNHPNTVSKFASQANQVEFLRDLIQRQSPSVDQVSPQSVEQETDNKRQNSPAIFQNTADERTLEELQNDEMIALQNDSLVPLKHQPESKEKFNNMNVDAFVKSDHNSPINEETVSAVLGDEIARVRTEQPYKIVTDAASNLVNKEIEFTRDRDLSNNNYVSYGFKIGNFGFEHKKAIK